jgi:hypothetical protein
MEPIKIYEQKLVLPLFNVEYVVVVMPTLTDGLNYIKDVFNNFIDVVILDDLSSKEVCIFTSNKGKPVVYILFFKEFIDKGREVARVVYHHCFHLSMEMMEVIRMDVDINTNPVQAYIVEELTYNVLKNVRKGLEFLEGSEEDYKNNDDLDL